MDIVIYIICFLIVLRWGYVLFKFLKTGEFKKKKYVKDEAYEGNIIGVLAYTCLRVVIICFLILMVLVSQDKSSDLVMWLLFIFGIFVLFAYPAYWLTRTSDKAKEKNMNQMKQAEQDFITKYGDYETYDVAHFEIINYSINAKLDDKGLKVVNMITDSKLSINPIEILDITEFFDSLYQQDFIKIIYKNQSLSSTCENVNSILSKKQLDFKIDPQDILKKDDDFIKQRRQDSINTIQYDLNVINDLIKEKGYVIMCLSNINYNYSYISIVKDNELQKFLKELEEKNEQ